MFGKLILLLRDRNWWWALQRRVTPGPTRFTVGGNESSFVTGPESRFVSASDEAEFTVQ